MSGLTALLVDCDEAAAPALIELPADDGGTLAVMYRAFTGGHCFSAAPTRGATSAD